MQTYLKNVSGSSAIKVSKQKYVTIIGFEFWIDVSFFIMMYIYIKYWFLFSSVVLVLLVFYCVIIIMIFIITFYF